MTERAKEIKNYICTHFCEETPATQRPLNCGFKNIWVPQNVAKTLYLLAKMIRPKRILEIGTLAGYSTLWLAKALDDSGELITMECDKERYEEAVSNIAFASLSHQVKPLYGDAIELMGEMIQQGEGPFDLVFIDADKAQYPEYLEPVIQLTRPGGVILADNLIPKRGEIGAPAESDNEAIEIYLFNQLIAGDPRLEAHILTTIVGENGRLDGLGIALVK